MRKFLATLLALAMALSLMVPAAWAEPADEPASATYEAVLGKTARKYGNIELDISTEEFMKAGFAYGDVVTVDVNGNSYEMPSARTITTWTPARSSYARRRARPASSWPSTTASSPWTPVWPSRTPTPPSPTNMSRRTA